MDEILAQIEEAMEQVDSDQPIALQVFDALVIICSHDGLQALVDEVDDTVDAINRALGRRKARFYSAVYGNEQPDSDTEDNNDDE